MSQYGPKREQMCNDCEDLQRQLRHAREESVQVRNDASTYNFVCKQLGRSHNILGLYNDITERANAAESLVASLREELEKARDSSNILHAEACHQNARANNRESLVRRLVKVLVDTGHDCTQHHSHEWCDVCKVLATIPLELREEKP